MRPLPLFSMPLSEAVATAFTGMLTVMSVLALLSVLIILLSKLITRLEARRESTALLQEPADLPAPPPAECLQTAPSLELIDTKETDAAILMAIVSHQSGIALEKLRFKRIRRLEDA